MFKVLTAKWFSYIYIYLYMYVCIVELMFYALGPCWFSFYVEWCIYANLNTLIYPSPYLSPLVTASLLSMSVSLFLFCKWIHLYHFFYILHPHYHMLFVFVSLYSLSRYNLNEPRKYKQKIVLVVRNCAAFMANLSVAWCIQFFFFLMHTI